MSLLLSALMSHILSLLEKELVNAEPEIVAVIIKEVNDLMSKLQSLIDSKKPSIAPIINPVIDTATKIIDSGIVSSGALLQQAGE